MTAAIASNASLRSLNTFGIDASAALFAQVTSVDALCEVLADRRVQGMPTLILGGGSNMLFTRDFDGLVVRVAIPGVERVGDDGARWLVRVGAGEPWHPTVARLLGDSLPGLENLALIPGSVGAAPIQNIGAYGVELAERLQSVEVFERNSGITRELSAADCRFGYRDSDFKRRQPGERVITRVTLALPKLWSPTAGYADVSHELKERGVSRPSARDVFDAVVAIRTRKLPDPATIGNAGSFFKNPVITAEQRHALLERFPALVHYDIGEGRYKLAAGWLIEACGLKGAVRGRAGVHARQALVLVNLGGATGAEIVALAREVQDAVLAKFGVALEPELSII